MSWACLSILLHNHGPGKNKEPYAGRFRSDQGINTQIVTNTLVKTGKTEEKQGNGKKEAIRILRRTATMNSIGSPNWIKERTFTLKAAMPI